MAHAPAPQWFVEGTVPTQRWLGQYTDLAAGKQGSNKELLIELFVTPNGSAMRTRWGKTGSIEGGGAQCHWESPADEYTFKAKVKKKSTTGDTPYTENKLIDQSTRIVVKPSGAKVGKSLNDPVSIFIGRLLGAAGKQIKSVLREGIGLTDFAPEQLDAAKEVLVNIAPMVERWETSRNASLKPELIRLSNRYFSLIPHQTGYGELQIPRIIVDAFSVAVTSKKRLELEYDFLDTLSAAVANKAAFQTDDSLDQLSALGADVTLADAQTTARIHKLMTSNLGNHRQYNRPGQVFVVRNPNVNSAFTAKGEPIGNVQELFHGSRLSNWQGIISQGIRIKPKGVPHAGSMFGNGAYFANNPMKSYLYTGDGYQRGGSDVRYMAVCAVALGKIKVHQSSHHYDSAPSGYHSVKGEAGYSLQHDEFIIYNTYQHDIRYVVEFND